MTYSPYLAGAVAAAIAAPLAGALLQDAPPGPIAYFAGVRIGAVDIDEARVFYTRHLGMDTLMDAPEHGFAVLGRDGLMFVLTRAAGAVDVERDQAHVRVLFPAQDPSQTARDMRDGGAGDSRIDADHAVLDPSGNPVLLIPHDEGPPVVEIVVTDLGRARRFYGEALGLEVVQEDERATVRVPGPARIFLRPGAEQPAPYDARRIAHTGLALGVADIRAAMELLEGRGVEFFQDQPGRSANVLWAAFADPDGNVHEVVQHLAPGQEDPGQDAEPPAGGGIESMAWLAGHWRTADGAWEEVWTAPAGGSMLGMARWVQDGRARLYEIMALEEYEGRLEFRILHFGPKLAGWESERDGPLTCPIVRVEGESAVFEAPDRDFPRRFVYRREGDALTVRLEGTRGGREVATEFRFERAGE